MSLTLSFNLKRSQIGIRCSRTKKCSQTLEINHFCPGICSAFQPSKNGYESNRGTFRFTIPISDIPMTPSYSLRSFRNWRLVCCELHVDTDFEIYGSSIGVRIMVCYIPLCLNNIPYFIPLWLNRKFRNLYRGATQNTPTSDSKNFSSCSLN